MRIADLKDADDATYQAELATNYPDFINRLKPPDDEVVESSRAPNLADYSLQHAYIFSQSCWQVSYVWCQIWTSSRISWWI